MKDKLSDMIQDAVGGCAKYWADVIAEKLVANGVTILPDGAMILTRAELDALNKYQERFKGQDAEAVIATEVAKEIFAEIEEGIKAAVSALQFENNPIHRRVKHETYSSLMRFIKTIEKKYTEEGK